MRLLKYQIGIIIRKPSVVVKLVLISLLFIFTIGFQLSDISGFSASMNGEGQMTVIAFLLHTFNYFDLAERTYLFGFILLLPDIVEDTFMPRHMIMMNKNRNNAAYAALLRISTMTVLYMLWFIFLTILMSGAWLHNFSLEWPGFLKKIYAAYGDTMSLIMIPKSAFESYTPVFALLLVLLRSFLGFLFLGNLAGLITLLTKDCKYGVLMNSFLALEAAFFYWDGYLGDWAYINPQGKSASINMTKFTIFPFFSFSRLSDDFTSWVVGAIIAGIILSLLTAAGIVCYYKKGDLGDANRDI